MTIEIIIIVSLGAILLLLGVIYAWYTAVRPSHPSATWAWVALGVGGTLAGIFPAQFLLTKNWLVSLLPLAYFGATGLPMMVGQLIKCGKQRWERDQFEERARLNEQDYD